MLIRNSAQHTQAAIRMKLNYWLIYMLWLFFNVMWYDVIHRSYLNPTVTPLLLLHYKYLWYWSLFLAVFYGKGREKIKYVIDHNSLLVGDYDYIAFQCDYTEIILYSLWLYYEYNVNGNFLLRLCYDYFVNKIYDYIYDCKCSIVVIDYNGLRLLKVWFRHLFLEFYRSFSSRLLA